MTFQNLILTFCSWVYVCHVCHVILCLIYYICISIYASLFLRYSRQVAYFFKVTPSHPYWLVECAVSCSRWNVVHFQRTKTWPRLPIFWPPTGNNALVNDGGITVLVRVNPALIGHRTLLGYP